MEAPSFKRVRTISLDKDGFMNCSCGKTGEYLLPCKHICSLVNNEDFFSVDMFHVRWHKQFSLFHGKDAGKECSPAQSKLLNEVFQTTRRTHYDSKGHYKGVPMKGSLFLKNLTPFQGIDLANEKVKFVLYVKDKSIDEPVQSTFTSMREFNSCDSVQTTRIDGDILGEFSLFSQEEFQESDMYILPNKRICHKSDDNSPYHQVIDGFERMLDITKNKEDIDEINMFFTNFVNKRIAERNINHRNKGNTLLFGENLKQGARIDKRYPFFYETI